MKTYSISELGKAFGLSRSTLLYYDRIGLLCASKRTTAGYRCYTQDEYDRLERITTLRATGLPLADIESLLSGKKGASIQILEKRLQEMEDEITALRSQQHVIVSMLQGMTGGEYGPVIDKEAWVNMLSAGGMDEDDMMRWHAEFEARSPDAHHDFLLSLGIPEKEALDCRARSRKLIRS